MPRIRAVTRKASARPVPGSSIAGAAPRHTEQDTGRLHRDSRGDFRRHDGRQPRNRGHGLPPRRRLHLRKQRLGPVLRARLASAPRQRAAVRLRDQPRPLVALTRLTPTSVEGTSSSVSARYRTEKIEPVPSASLTARIARRPARHASPLRGACREGSPRSAWQGISCHAGESVPAVQVRRWASAYARAARRRPGPVGFLQDPHLTTHAAARGAVAHCRMPR